MIWDGIFKYDEESPSCLVRDYDIAQTNQYGAVSIRKTKGKPTGRLSRRGYWEVSYNNFLYKAHRIIYEMYYGEILEGWVVDHIDGDKSNNKLENLRMVENKVNTRNTGHEKSKTGFKGVYLTKHEGRVLGYRASYTDLEKKSHFKYFNFSDFEDNKNMAFAAACEWRVEQLELLNQQGAGYTDRHIYGDFHDSF